MQGHADFGVVLEATDARSVPGARIEHHDRRLVRIDAIVPAVLAHLRNPQQSVVRRMVEATRVEDRLVFEVQERRQAGALMREHVVGPLPKRVPEQDRPLPKVNLIVEEVLARSHVCRRRLSVDVSQRGSCPAHRPEFGSGPRTAPTR